MKDEIDYLKRLANVKDVSEEGPVMDGGAIVITTETGAVSAEVVVEVRLPGSVELLAFDNSSKHGSLMVYLQNRSDKPLKLGTPEFLLTGGLRFPWKVGTRLLSSIERGEVGEVFMWQIPITGNESIAEIGADIGVVCRKCRKIVEDSARQIK